MIRNSISLAVVCITIIGATAYADGPENAQKLKDDALEILKANANGHATPEQYASCIYKLEKAQLILAKAGDNDSNLAQEVNTSLFWARKFSNVQIVNELAKLRGGTQEPPPPMNKPEPPAPPVDKDFPTEPPSAMAEAKKAFDTADNFARSHTRDDYAVALSWFKMANDYSGTDFALKALGLAREAQTRFAAMSARVALPKEAVADTPEMKLVADGETLAHAHKFDEAIEVFKVSLAKKETLIVHSRLGLAYYDRGMQMKDDFNSKKEKADKEYWDTRKIAFVVRHGHKFFDPTNPAFVAAEAKCDDLAKQSYKALDYFDKAESEFKAVLRLAPDKKDFDAAGHIGLCLSVHGDINFRLNAQTVLNKFLADYTPSNDLERSLYEYCKTELARIRKM